ncbi:unnamed protein product [Prorocentrum cordatum]|uniref:Uncharacterized protein n=1 Tax=Prorocentrum cordatum TaxID=2364126 RepID=A0ABN9W800_9DINO|nr:unnamed protein product [Polarella glacialis]
MQSKAKGRVYREHRVYLDSDPGELVVPVAVFVDSAQYGGAAGAGRQRSIVTVSLINLITGQCVSAAVPKWVIDVSVGWEGGSYFDMLQFCIVRASSLLRSGVIMRDIEFLHAFCGADSPGRYMRARGRSVATFDVANDASEDIMTCAGMLWLTILCYRLMDLDTDSQSISSEVFGLDDRMEVQLDTAEEEARIRRSANVERWADTESDGEGAEPRTLLECGFVLTRRECSPWARALPRPGQLEGSAPAGGRQLNFQKSLAAAALARPLAQVGTPAPEKERESAALAAAALLARYRALQQAAPDAEPVGPGPPSGPPVLVEVAQPPAERGDPPGPPGAVEVDSPGAPAQQPTAERARPPCTEQVGEPPGPGPAEAATAEPPGPGPVEEPPGPGPVEVAFAASAAGDAPPAPPRPPGTEPVEAAPGPCPVEAAAAAAAARVHHLALVNAFARAGGRPAEEELAELLRVPTGGKRRQLQRRLGAALDSLPDPELAELMGRMAGRLRNPQKRRWQRQESSVIVVSWLLIAAVGLLLSAAIGGWSHVRQCFDRRAIATFAPAGVGWALADVCEVLAVAKIDPAMYGVISQARLLGSAAACRLILGNRQSKVQWGVLGALSLVCMAYCMVLHRRRGHPDGSKSYIVEIGRQLLLRSEMQPAPSTLRLQPRAAAQGSSRTVLRAHTDPGGRGGGSPHSIWTGSPFDAAGFMPPYGMFGVPSPGPWSHMGDPFFGYDPRLMMAGMPPPSPVDMSPRMAAMMSMASVASMQEGQTPVAGRLRDEPPGLSLPAEVPEGKITRVNWSVDIRT